MTTETTTTDIQVGTIFRSSWGYEQTNIDYFEVVSRTAHTVTLRAIAKESAGATSSMSEYVKPMPGKFTGEPFRRKLTVGHTWVRIHQSAGAQPWDGQKDHQSSWA